MHDRSATGARLVLARDMSLPPRFVLYDDETGETSMAMIAWRRGATLGVRYCAQKPRPLKAGLRLALSGRYFAVPD
jgi:hypothetical protein